eukprot:gene110-721_t
MANKNQARFKELATKPDLQQKKVKMKNRKQRSDKTDEFIITGETSNVFMKNRLASATQCECSPKDRSMLGSATNIDLKHNTQGSYDKSILVSEKFQNFSDWNDSEMLQHRHNSSGQVKDNSWFISPVHRPDEEAASYSDLLHTKPLAASVMKAKAEGTLIQEYDESLEETNPDDFNMELFQRTDMKLHKAQFENTLGFQSPYHFELAELRRNKLKLEEAYLLKLRCQAELEETRGPKPKWYELKTKHFNKELKKNNNIVENSNDWQDMFEYRNEVVKASGKWGNLSI